MIEKLKTLHRTHVNDYINLFNRNNIEYSIIVKTENIKVTSSKDVKLKDLFEEYISIRITSELRENIDFMPKSLTIKAEELNGVKLNCNLMIMYHSIHTFAIDNKVVYICNIDEETEGKIKLQEHYSKVKRLEGD